MVEARQAASISQYEIREGVFNAGNGGDDIETVFKKLEAELERKSFPLITGSSSTTQFGLRAGDWVSVFPFGRIQPFSMRITSIRHTVSGSDMQVDLELSSRTFVGSDAVPEMISRIENLEKINLDPRSITGKIIREIGVIAYTEAQPESLKIRSEVQVFLAAIAKFKGGGKIDLVSSPFQGGFGVFTGSGSFNALRFAAITEAFNATGGGSVNATSNSLGVFVYNASFKGAGNLNLISIGLIENSRTLENGSTRSVEDDSIRVIE